MTRSALLVEDKPGEYRVWAEDAEFHPGARCRYVGPVAHVNGNSEWVYVTTDDYEGVAMINRETLPKLIEALQRLEKHLIETAN
jgi:hypothetical protein